jgi:DNA-binding beta-propeller fold protein YncE
MHQWSEKNIFGCKAFAAVLFFVVLLSANCGYLTKETHSRYRNAYTLAGLGREFTEPFGIAVRGGAVYVSDGDEGVIKKISADGGVSVFARGFETPSDIAFDGEGNLIVADSGSHSIKKADADGNVTTIAGTDGVSGSADGDALSASFNAPIGVAAAADGKVWVADTYNDSIRLIENGKVTTVATGFDTPVGIAVYREGVLIADMNNRRICLLDKNGSVETLAGGGSAESKVHFLGSAGFDGPTHLAVAENGTIYIADGTSIKAIHPGVVPLVETIVSRGRGYGDGRLADARFSRISGIAVDAEGRLLIADSDNQTVRVLSAGDKGKAATHDEIAKLRYSPEEFRGLQPPRWPFDPPNKRRDIAGTLGELRGKVVAGEENSIWFHNGLDIAGAYGETARFVRTEKVLDPAAAQNFGTLRELLRMPTMGYIHIRLGRVSDGKPFDDRRFQFSKGIDGKMNGVRVSRGTKFEAGDAIGTLNAMNHVHLIAGRSGAEMNALAALELPDVADTTQPIIESVAFFDKNWTKIETESVESRIHLNVPTRVVVRAFDRMDGNPERRRLGVYRVGYKLLKAGAVAAENTAFTMLSLPRGGDAELIYAPGSHSGATGVTIFNYIATNTVFSLLDGTESKEGFIDPAGLENGTYTLRVYAEDRFGNIAEKEITVEVNK